MNLRARLSERVHIENIREILHYIQDDERLREEIYRYMMRTASSLTRHCGFVPISRNRK